MLTEQAMGLTARIGELASRRRQVQNEKAFRDRASQLAIPAQCLMLLVGTLTLFRQHGIPVTVPEGKAWAFKSHVDELNRAYQNDPASIVQSDASRRYAFWTPIREFPSEIEGALATSWKEYVTSEVRVPQPDLLTVLQRVPAFRQPVAAIRQLILEAEQVTEQLPQSEVVFGQVEELGMRMRHAWSQLNSNEISGEILAFLRTVTAGTATLQHITPEVQQWLERHDLLKSFKVTL